ncbi:MAG TPA: membrane protein insertase YidC [Verrucomicrobiae bacterium]|nr:membrane protein insertase YidC [Verrucomicrobiae bacterium]
MAESNKPSGYTPQQVPMERNLLIAFVLIGAVMWISQTYFSPPPKKPASLPQTVSQPAAGGATPAPAPKPAPVETTVSPVKPAPNATPEQVLPHLVIQTDLYRVEFSNQGGTVRSWQLRQYHGSDGKPLDLVNTAAGMDFPFSLYFNGANPSNDINWRWYGQKADPDGLGVRYEYSDGHTTVRKVFRFQQHSYSTAVATQVTQDGKPIPHLLEWRGGFGDLTVASAAANQRTLYFDVTQNKLVEQNAKAASNGPATASGNFSFGGLADNYFAAVFLPDSGSSMQTVTFADRVKTPLDGTPQPFTGVAVGDGDANRYDLFVGPKDLNLLGRINPKLTQIVDFGWFWFLAKPLFQIVNYVNGQFVRNYGWSIVLVTILINFALFPLKINSMKSMRKMQALKPQIDAINNKYKGISLRDPRKGDQNQEVMDLYKKHGVNPMGGCLPMVLQIPFFIAFYKVFSVSVEMRGASWLWVSDLSQPEHLAIRILPIVMIASQFIMQKMTPQAAGDPAQQKMMMLMPLVFGFMFYNFPSGLVLYYLTSNLVSMLQQWFFNKTSLANVAAESVLPPKKTGRK